MLDRRWGAALVAGLVVTGYALALYAVLRGGLWVLEQLRRAG